MVHTHSTLLPWKPFYDIIKIQDIEHCLIAHKHGITVDYAHL